MIIRNITRTPYVACAHLSQDSSGYFIIQESNESALALTSAYSLAKYGSYKDLKYFARKIVRRFYEDLDSSGTLIRIFFENLCPHNDRVILMTPGYRNVKASGNIMFDLALPYINAKLTILGFPIIANFKLIRLADPCPNYAMLSRLERAKMALVTDHILPGKCLYNAQNTHVIYGDDIYITGESSERTKADALSKGALSFLSVFAVMMDESVAEQDPGVEEKLNRSRVTEKLDETALEILRQDEMIPVIRTLELLLSEANLSELARFLPQIPAANALKIYTSYMANGSLENSQYIDGLNILRNYLHRLGRVDISGLPLWQ